MEWCTQQAQSSPLRVKEPKQQISAPASHRGDSLECEFSQVNSLKKQIKQKPNNITKFTLTTTSRI
jgi:hypothetical protein